MSQDLYIWDPARHPPLPATDEEAYDIKQRLRELKDSWNSTFSEFGNGLVQRFEADATIRAGELEAFWDADPRKVIAACKFAAVCLRI